MPKRKPIHEPRDMTLKVNDAILDRLEALSRASNGFRGNTHEDVAMIALRAGIRWLEGKTPHDGGAED